MIYGHLDKQPPLTEGWSEGLGPYTPVVRNNKLYARGASDDGYTVFSTIIALKACKQFNLPYANCVICLETGEESGSDDFIYFLPQIRQKYSNVDVILILDGFTQTYDRIWVTDSLRGVVNFELEVKTAQNQQTKYSCTGENLGGIVPSPFRILQLLLNRLYDIETGKLKFKEMYPEIPQEVIENSQKVGNILQDEIWKGFTILPQCQRESADNCQLIINNSWLPCLEIIGMSQFPSCQENEKSQEEINQIVAKVSIRLPPGVDETIIQRIKDVLLVDIPFNTQVEVKNPAFAKGYSSKFKESFKQCLNESCKVTFSQEILSRGDGGTIGIMDPLQKSFENADIVILGVLSPESNAHAPNESLDLEFTKKFTIFLSGIFSSFTQNSQTFFNQVLLRNLKTLII